MTLEDVVLPTDHGHRRRAVRHRPVGHREPAVQRHRPRARPARGLDGWAEDHYDYVIIDCPPTLGLLTINALVAADGVIIPVQTQYYALKGFTALNKVITQIRAKGLNPNLRILGILPTFYDARTMLGRDMLDELGELGDHHVFDTMVKQTVRLARRPWRAAGDVVRHARTPRGLPRAGPGGDRTWLDPTSGPRPPSAWRGAEELSPVLIDLISPMSHGTVTEVHHIAIDRITPTRTSLA